MSTLKGHFASWREVLRKRFGRPEIASRSEPGLAGVRMSSEAHAFCQRNGFARELIDAIDSAKKCFSTVGSPVVNLVQDPEVDDTSYLVIEIQVRGEVRDNVVAHRKFATETAKSLGRNGELIKLHYDII